MLTIVAYFIKIFKELAIIFAVVQGGLWATGYFDFVTKSLQSKNSGPIGLYILLSWIAWRSWFVHLYAPYERERLRKLKKLKEKHRVELEK